MSDIPLYNLDAAVSYAVRNSFTLSSTEVSIASHVLNDSDGGDGVPVDCFIFMDFDEKLFSAVGFIDGKPACSIGGKWSSDALDGSDGFFDDAFSYLNKDKERTGPDHITPFDVVSLESVKISGGSGDYGYDNPLCTLLDTFMDAFRGRFILVEDIPLIPQYIHGGDVYGARRVGFLGVTPPGFEDIPVIVLG